MSTSGVYVIKNTANGKFYVGSAMDVDRRWRDHRYALRAGKHINVKLQRAWNKYGEEAFLFKILETVQDTERLLEREQEWLDLLEAVLVGYNISLSATAPNFGTVLSEEHRAKISASNMGRKQPPSVGAAVAERNRTRVISAETRAKMGLAGKNRAPISEETRAKMKASWQLRKLAEETRPKKLASRIVSEATRAKISAAHAGKQVSEETKQKISEACRKRQKEGWALPPISEETRRKMSEAQRRRRAANLV